MVLSNTIPIPAFPLKGKEKSARTGGNYAAFSVSSP